MSAGASNSSPKTVDSCLVSEAVQLSQASAFVRSERALTEVAPLTCAASTKELGFETPTAKLSALVSSITGAAAACAGAADRMRADTATVLSTAPARTSDMLLLDSGGAVSTARASSATPSHAWSRMAESLRGTPHRLGRTRARGYHGGA